jgi:iron-sulfur cluster assembly protein
MASNRLGATARVINTGRRMLPTKNALTLTPAAINRIKQLLTDRPDVTALKVVNCDVQLIDCFQIGVKQRGCNGLTYTLEYANERSKFDEEVIQDGARILIDSKAQLTLLGTEMDFVETKLAAEFVFNNPNIKGTCGCGESFNI